MLLLRYWKPAALILLLALSYWWGYSTKATSCERDMLAERVRAEKVVSEYHKAERDAVEAARQAERRHAANLAAIAAQHERDKADAKAAYDRDVAGLRSGAIRLRDEWRGCETDRVSGDAAATRLADENARLREAGAAAIVQDAREADDWIKRLQDVIRSGQ